MSHHKSHTVSIAVVASPEMQLVNSLPFLFLEIPENVAECNLHCVLLQLLQSLRIFGKTCGACSVHVM